MPVDASGDKVSLWDQNFADVDVPCKAMFQRAIVLVAEPGTGMPCHDLFKLKNLLAQFR